MPLIDPRSENDPANAPLARLVRVLDKRGVDYTFTGSFSLGFWAQPRSSKDVDVVVLLEPDRKARKAVLDDLADAGFTVPIGALSDLERVFSCALKLKLPNGGSIIVELLLPEPEREKLTRRIVSRARRMPFPGLDAGMKVISPEDLVLYKLLLFRDGSGPFQTDDQKDIRGLLALRGKDLDIGYIFLALSVDESLSSAELNKRKRWLQKTLADLGIKRHAR